MKKFISLVLVCVLSVFSSVPVFAGTTTETATTLATGNNVMSFFVSSSGYTPNDTYQVGVSSSLVGLEGYILDFDLTSYDTTVLSFEDITLQAPSTTQANDGFDYMIEMPKAAVGCVNGGGVVCDHFNLFRQLLMLPGQELFVSGSDYFVGLDGASDNSADFQVTVYESTTEKNLGNVFATIDTYYFISVIETYLNYDVVDGSDANIDGTNVFLRVGLLTETEENHFGDFIGVRPHLESWVVTETSIDLLQADASCNYSSIFSHSAAEDNEVFMSDTENHGFGLTTKNAHLHIDDADIDKEDGEYKVNVDNFNLLRSFPSNLMFDVDFDGVMKNGAECVAAAIPEFGKYTYYIVVLFAIFLMRNRLKDLVAN